MRTPNGNRNYNPNGERRPEGSRIALLPQKTRKIYSYKQLKKALSEGLRIPAAVPVSRFQFFAKKDGESKKAKGEPVGAFVGSDPQTIRKKLELARKNNWAVLYQGTILINKKTAKKLRENRRIAKGDWEKIAQLDQQDLFGEEFVRLAYRVLIDIDKKDEGAVRRLVKYLLKLKVYPEVWETQKGYHIYLYFYYRKVYQERKVIDEDGKERVEKVWVGYELPYADDYRIKDVEECLKALCAKLGIKPDIVSAKHAVWLEGFPNPLKDGFATKRVFEGFPLPLQDLWKKLLNVNPAKVRQKVRQNKPRYYRKRKPKEKDTDKVEEIRMELKNLVSGEHSSVFHALNQHGTLIACRKLWKAGYKVSDIKAELETYLKIRTKSDEKYLEKFLDYFEKNYTRPTTKQKSPPKEEEHKEEPKHEHYWELAEKVREALEKGYRKTTHIAQYVGCSRDRVKHLKSFLQKHGYSLEDLLTRHEEVLAFLKAHAKGGNKWQRKKEWNREAWLEEFHRQKAEYIQQRKREAEIRRAKKRAELKEQGIDPDGWVHAPVWFLPVEFLPEESGHIGDIRVYFGMAADGSRATRTAPAEKQEEGKRPERTKEAYEKQKSEGRTKKASKQRPNPEQHEKVEKNPGPEKNEKAEKQKNRKGEKAKKEEKPPQQAPTQKRGKPGFPSAKVVQKAVKGLEECRRSSEVVVVSRQELEFSIYLAWWEADKEKANKQAVSEFIDRFEGILWRKLPAGYYGLLVGSDKVRVKIRDYVLELMQAKKNGQPPTNGNGSVGSELSTHNGTNGNGEPSADGNGSLGSTSLPTNGNGKYDIDQIIRTLQKEGKVHIPPQFLHEIVRELRRRGFSVIYWASGLIELVGGDDEIPF
ncbi:hypothetical protein [Thermocrinis sp.]|jgi:hypothetical protein|uniref:hypothetical protein n=1 Tax=Thermocrinis sp. TaxID=2024383 RepID=UPI003C07F3C9